MRLTSKITSILSIILIIFFIGFTYVFTGINSQKVEQELHKDASTISLIIDSFSKEILLKKDYSTLQGNIDKLNSNFKNILCIEITQNNSKVIRNNCTNLKNNDFKEYKFEIKTNDTNTIAYTNLYLKDKTKEIIKDTIINNFVFFAILYILLLTVINLTRKKILDFSKDIEYKQKSLDEAQKLAKTGSWIIDYLNNDVFWSDKTFKICNLDKTSSLTTQTLFELIHKEDQFLLNENQAKQNEDYTYEGEFRILDKQDKIKYVYLKWSNILNSKGEKVKTIGIIQDITNKVLQKRQEAEHNAILVHQQRLIHKAEILEMVGHHWRQPLNQIALASQMIELTEDSSLSDNAKKNLNDIREITKQLSDTINDFKGFFNDQKTIRRANLKHLIDDTIRLVNHQIEENHINLVKNINLNCNYELNICISDFSQSLLAILINAIEVLENKEGQKSIEITLDEIENKNILLEIKDNGGGIDKNYLPFIFDPYFSTKAEKNGTGLGLFMTKNIILNSFEGIIHATNTADGACFQIIIPRKEETNNYSI